MDREVSTATTKLAFVSASNSLTWKRSERAKSRQSSRRMSSPGM